METWQRDLSAAAQAAGLTSGTDRFFFLRHGQTDYNLNGIVQGWTDIPLNATGEAQAVEAAAVLRGQGITALMTSPLGRARRTAEIVSATIGVSITGLDPRLRERSFGGYENQPDPGSVWQRGDRDMETPVAFASRVVAGLNEALCCGVPLVVAHGGVRRVLLFALGLAVPPQAELNAVPLEFIRREGAWTVIPVLAGGRAAGLSDA